ncbi:MAG: response regulator [Polyangia bacterium]
MPKQILLVDDSVTIARVVEITFAQEDFAITVAKTADEGIAKAKQLHPDLVLVDITLSGKTGYDIVSAIREDAALSKTACLVLAGNFAPYDEAKGSAAGCDGYIVKPFETQPLIDKAKEVIAHRSGGAVHAPVAPVAAPAPAPVSARPGVESLSKPLSTVAAETSARMSAMPAAPAPLTPITPPVAAAQPVVAQRPTPKATLMGIPVVNPATIAPPAVPAAQPVSSPNVLRPPAAVAAPVAAPAPIIAPRPIEVPRPVPIHVEAPRVPVAPPRAVATPNVLRPPAAAHTIPTNVPQMPRPSLVPGVATPSPRAAEAPQPVRNEVTPPTGAPAHMAGMVSAVADRVPAAISARGPEYEAIAKLSREVIEQIVWEVVPELAETIIRAELDRLVRERQNA